MNRTLAPIALLPTLVWVFLLWAVWHFGWFALLFPVSLFIFAVPATFAYVGVVSLPSSTTATHPSNFLVLIVSAACLSVAYACSLYAVDRIANLLPEIYKFGNTFVDVSRSTAWLWATLSVVCLALAWPIYRTYKRTTRCSLLARATIGIVVCTSIFFVPFLLSAYVGYRA